MNNIIKFFDINKREVSVPIEEQRQRWLKEFLKAFLVVFSVYACMYFVRNNLKAAQPLLKKSTWIYNIRTWLYRFWILYNLCYGENYFRIFC